MNASLDDLLTVHISPIPKNGITVGGLRLETDGTRKLCYLDDSVDLTPREYSILLPFFMNPGRVLSPLEIMGFPDPIRNFKNSSWSGSGLVSNCVYYIKDKLPVMAQFLRTDWNGGYVLRLPEGSQYLSVFKEVRLGNISLIPIGKTAYRNLEELSLRPAEYEILRELMLNAGHTVSPMSLMAAFTDIGFMAKEQASVDMKVHIFNLRKKLGDDRDLIATNRGVGYQMLASPPIN